MIRNLVDNGLKYSRGQVRLRVEARAASTRFTVSGDGRGIPAAERRESSRDSTGSTPTSTRTRGTGLGLYVARALVARMDGRIGLLPRERRATFFVDLPRL